jgi:signal transduction histidine kinase
MGVDLFQKPKHLIVLDDEDVLGVTTREDLQSKLELICAATKHPVALYCFYDYIHELKDGKPVYVLDEKRQRQMVRIDSTIASVTLHWCCEQFRICAGYKFCEENDSDHAQIFRCILKNKDGLDEEKPIDVSDPEKFQKHIQDKIDQLYQKRSSYYNEKAPKPQFLNGYLDYYCSILGYHELIFPVAVCGRVLGAVFCGQISTKADCEKTEKAVRKAFLDTRPDIFSGYDWIKSGYQEIEFRKDILIGGDKYKDPQRLPIQKPDAQILFEGNWVNDKRHSVLSDSEFNKLIEITEREINGTKRIEGNSGLGEQLEKIVKERRAAFVRRVFQEITQQFHKQTPGKLAKAEQDMRLIQSYWNMVQDLLQPLITKFPIRDLQIFGADSVAMGAGNYPKDELLPCVVLLLDGIRGKEMKSRVTFKVLASDKNVEGHFILTCPDRSDARYGRVKLNRVSVNISLEGNPPENVDPYLNDPKNANVFYLPVRDNLSHSAAIVWAFSGETEIEDKQREFIAEEIRKEFDQLATLIFYVNWYLLDSILQANTELVLRYFRHEIAHILLGYDNLNNHFIQNNRLLNLPNDNITKIKDIKNDFQRNVQMLRYIERNILILTKPFEEIEVEKDRVFIFKNILSNWSYLYTQLLRNKRLQVVIPRVKLADKCRPAILTDESLLEQIVYNLFSNAFKYCYWGTNIYIDCKKDSPDALFQSLTITDFGGAIEENEKPYALYYRKNDPRMTVEGSGIGLYLIKKICSFLGFKVTHTSKELSEFNIPLIDQYINRNFLIYTKDAILEQKLKDARKQIGEIELERIVCRSRTGVLREKQIIDQINIPTHEVSFTIEIPDDQESDTTKFYEPLVERFNAQKKARL